MLNYMWNGQWRNSRLIDINDNSACSMNNIHPPSDFEITLANCVLISMRKK